MATFNKGQKVTLHGEHLQVVAFKPDARTKEGGTEPAVLLESDMDEPDEDGTYKRFGVYGAARMADIELR